MSADQPNPGPFAEFLADYFVECEEHLSVARRSLLALEPSVDQPQPERHLLDELFRSFHSLKGLSAMVGVHQAEQIAHEMESYLSVLRKGQALLTVAGLEALIAGVKAVEDVVAARERQMSPPDVTALLKRLAALGAGGRTPSIPESGAGSGGALSLSADREAALANAVSSGARAWVFSFTPSAALAERGINVNVVRQRLQEIGQLIQAAPRVQEGGQIAFTFLVASKADEGGFAAWRSEGMEYLPYEPPAPPPSVKVEAQVPERTGVSLVRVDLARLDELMRLVGELVITRARLDDGLKRLAGVAAADLRALQETNLALERQLRDLREGVMRVRMVPVREVFARMQFVVRDLAREQHKKTTLDLSGQETEIDKFVVERMMDPLLHLVRNAVSHALETPEERTAAGKPPVGRIALRANTTGETITIEVEDDGRGIDAGQVLARARSTGLPVPEGPADVATLLEVLCAPGFSTRDEADRASGRGIGMAVVRTVVEELGGSLVLRTEVGRGTCFQIRLPLTLAIADALVVAVGGQRYAVPQVTVREVIQVEPAAVKALENNEILAYRGGVLPLLRLGTFFGLPSAPTNGMYALVIGEGPGAVGLAVDRILGLREVVVRPLADPLVRVPGVAGATELGDGRAVLILDAAALARASRHPRRAGRPGNATATIVPAASVN